MEKNKKCITCAYHGKATMVCFNDKNEGMRVYNPTNTTCPYYEAYNIKYDNVEYDYGHNVNYKQYDE